MTTDDQFLADLQNKADRMHKASADADRPPANTWAGILAATSTNQRINNEEDEMTTLSMQQSVLATPVFAENHWPVSRFFNLAASLLVIAALAFGGWFAAIQLNDPVTPTPDPRFAAMATPNEAQSQTCDVEPLSVNRVMEIVEHPGYFMREGAAGVRSDTPGMASPPNATLWELDSAIDLYLEEGNSAPAPEQFASATSVANRYLDCMAFGTQGQVWNFYSPVFIQKSILAEFPVYANEQEVRARVEERLNEPAYAGEASWSYLPFISEIELAGVNPDRQLAILQSSDALYYDQVMTVGVSITDTEGREIVLTNGNGRNLIPNDPFGGNNDIFLTVRIAKVQGTDNWFIIPWPSDAEIGL